MLTKNDIGKKVVVTCYRSDAWQSALKKYKYNKDKTYTVKDVDEGCVWLHEIENQYGEWWDNCDFTIVASKHLKLMDMLCNTNQE